MATRALPMVLVRAVAFGPFSVQRLILSMTVTLQRNVSVMRQHLEVFIPSVPLEGPSLGYYYVECKCRSDLSRCLFHLMLLDAVNQSSWDFNSDYFTIYAYVCCKIMSKSWGLTDPMA
jgi:hypothetical protein